MQLHHVEIGQDPVYTKIENITPTLLARLRTNACREPAGPGQIGSEMKMQWVQNDRKNWEMKKVVADSILWVSSLKIQSQSVTSILLWGRYSHLDVKQISDPKTIYRVSGHAQRIYRGPTTRSRSVTPAEVDDHLFRQ